MPMRLIDFSYRDESLGLKNLKFGPVSLIVGRNATGKSRTLFQLNNLIELLKQPDFLSDGEFKVKFQKGNGDTFAYHLKISNSNRRSLGFAITEQLTINDQFVLQRTPGRESRVLNAVTHTLDPVNPPEDRLIIHVHRDVKKHPFFENIAAWAGQSYSFKFASITTDFHTITWETGISVMNNIDSLFNALSDADKSQFISELQQIGFAIESLSIKRGKHVDSLQVKEKGLKDIIAKGELSQGMLRSIYLVIFIRFVISSKKPSSIIIDDLCEGLDYDRATRLGKMIFSLCDESNIQLIAASNNMFLMDVVDLEYWNVLQRDGGTVTALNSKNNPDLFESFKFTGLSNFDFFSSDFIPQKINNLGFD